MEFPEDFFTRVFEKVDIPKILNEAIEKHQQPILDLNKGQLWDGIGFDGNGLHPTYLEDPYFKTKEAAINYARWKQSITPNPNRKFESPNLYLNGYYYSSLQLKTYKNEFTIVAGNSFSKGIEEKYPYAEGLTDGSIQEVGILILDDVRLRFSEEILK